MKKSLFYLWAIFALFISSRLFPYISNPVPLGYDGGLYLYILKIYPHIPQWYFLGFAPAIYAVAYPVIKLGVNPEALLIPLSILSQIALFLSMYYVTKKTLGGKTALWAVFFLTVSVIQFRTFWFYYVNNTFALSLLLFTLYFLWNKSFFKTVILGVITGLFHLPTFLVLFLIMVMHGLFDKKNRLFYLKSLGGIVLITSIYYFPQYKYVIEPFIKPIASSTIVGQIVTGNAPSSGTFYPVMTSFLLTMLYLPFSLYGFFKVIKDKNSYKPFTTAFVICLILVIAKFFFYQRLFIILDIFLIIFASVGITGLSERYKKNDSVIDLIRFYPVILILFIAGFVLKTGQPLINKEVFTEIKQFGKTHEKGYILSTAKEDSAWLMGYTDNHVIAWAYGGYDKYWKYSEWMEFFDTQGEKEKINLLKKLPPILYIFVTDKTSVQLRDLIKSKCLEKESGHFYKFVCFS